MDGVVAETSASDEAEAITSRVLIAETNASETADIASGVLIVEASALQIFGKAILAGYRSQKWQEET